MVTYRSRLHTGAFLALAVGVSAVATLWGYQYGSGDHIEQLPLVFRAIDPGYLSRDFFTNAGVEFGPRFFYAHALALAARVAPLPWVSLALLLCANFVLAVVSALFAVDLFDGLPLAGLMAMCAVMTVSTFGLGYNAIVFDHRLLPSSLATPVVALAILIATRRRVVLAVGLCGIASLIQPLIGLESAALILCGWLALAIFEGHRDRGKGWLKAGATLLSALGLLAVFAALSVAPWLRTERISTQQFIEILAYFRHPHHYVPSTFPGRDYLEAGAFLLAAGIAFEDWRRKHPLRAALSWFLLGLVGAILVFCIGGYVFVELVPSRLWTTAQPFRMLILLKWLGLLLIAGWAAARIAVTRAEVPTSDGLITLVALPSPLALGVSASLNAAFTPLGGRYGHLLSFGPALLVTLLAVQVSPPAALSWFLFTCLAILALAVVFAPKPWLGAGIWLAGCLGLLLLLFVRIPALPPALESIIPRPMFTQASYRGDDIDISHCASGRTPADALFLTPPGWGEFRLNAVRAIVVDFKAFPFQDAAMVEWRARLIDSYGPTALSGFAASTALERAYRSIPDSRLLAVHEKYGMDYAVLYAETATSMPIVCSNKSYKVVKVGE